MINENILIVEDDEDILELIRFNLSNDGYGAVTAVTGEDGLTKARSNKPDLIILDLMLPRMSGLDVYRILKRENDTESIPIIMLTAKSEESDIVSGLELGADDYITKPFSVKVLLARVRSVLRRSTTQLPDDSAAITVNEMVIDPGKYEVAISGNSINLTYSEFEILHRLAARPGWVFTRYQIVDAIHGDDHPVSDRSVDVSIVGLRKKLGDYGKYIETVRGVGYRFREGE